ncbi:unnamed protein product [Acanthoscelides obtectus]|uniref:DUF4371 domain-containing protein n=1 Tax=Acanthoscelides obtectus TaxID=200917 RepID=A0A9P0PSI4_ACAOB|nr:unnamed protein product [Acanthoscelides obtectus]CAK1656822.1 52 kDa repressor of the inhibitor of the protein kinase [Acanthoscelides obtectus]
MIGSERIKQVSENRQRLTPIVESIIFLGLQNILLRGHRDSGRLFSDDSTNDEDVLNSEGNFRELIRFGVESGDNLLKKKLRELKLLSIRYVHKQPHPNEIIECCGEEILDTVLCRVRQSQYYSIIFDETTAISHKSQMPIVLRYCYQKHIYEDFMGFVDCYSNFDEDTMEPKLTGQILAQTAKHFIKTNNLDSKPCVGIGIDTCNLMLGEQKGAVMELQKCLPNALKSQCANYVLNLSISKSSSVQAVRNTVGKMKEVIAFFKTSAKRNTVLKRKLDGYRIHSMCETRWTERHDSVLQFESKFEKIVEVLNIISNWKDRQASSKAESLKIAITATQCIVSLKYLCDTSILALSDNLSKILQ